MTELQFNLELKEISVKLTGKDKVTKTYILKELDGAVRDKFLDEMASRMKYSPTGKVQGLTKYEGLQARLLSLCLYDDKGELVSLDVIQTYPASVQNALFAEAQTLSGLDVDEKELAKLKNE